jgi:hypothetical protein
VHNEAQEWVRGFGSPDPLRALDIGGRDINGHCRGFFPATDWRVLDIAPGPGVDIVADAAEWVPDQSYDLVLCTEVFEHTAVWPGIVRTAFAALVSGGSFIVTCAGPGRFRHSAVDGGRRLFPGEHYANVSTDELAEALTAAGFVDVVTDSLGEDTRAVAYKP